MDLWTESDNHELASAPVEQAEKPGRAVGTRFNPSTNAVLLALRAWLLADYTAPYCRSLAATRIFRRCFWIDASGGIRSAARKITGSQGRAESRLSIFDDLAQSGQPAGDALSSTNAVLRPLVVLAGDLARESRPITLQGIVLAGSKGNDKQNKENTTQTTFVLPKESSMVNADWREVAPELLPAIEQFAAMFLLNPLAVSKVSASKNKKSEIPFLTSDELAPLLQRTTPTELCLLLMHRQVETILFPALRTPAGAAAFSTLLRNDRWKALLAQESEPTVDKVIDLLSTALHPHFPFVQRIVFPMLIGPATIENAPCSLLFATRRQDSLACMNDAVCGYRRRLEQESHSGTLSEAWFAAQQAERTAQAMQQLREDTLRAGRARSPRRWPDLRQQMLLARFGQCTLREYDELICNLLQAGEVRCEWRQPGMDGLRVPGNEDILLWQVKKNWTR
ncbi:MAG TPA: hypothetical protein VKR83_12705 [Ktedonobacteraceae bacterium]|nr:hypothetical protein [Ktedonobacteraceae bacterium]